ncbi:MAG: AMP-binding protein [Accumulibacter sp.]|jgi:long-chain acyl-CoA synthetase
MNFWQFAGVEPTAPAAIDETGQCHDYAALSALVDRAAAILGQLGEHKLVFLLAGNRIGCLVAYLACLRAGQVALLLPESITDELLHGLTRHYQPDWLIRGTGASPADVPIDGTDLFLQACNARGSVLLHPELTLLLNTSGTTGSPRLVRLPARALNANAKAIASYLGLGPGERAITVLPMSYSYGLSIVNSHLASGGTLVLSGHGVMQKEFWATMREHAVTSLAGVPYTYQMLERIGLQRMNLPALRTLTQAGGRLDPRLISSFADLACQRGWRFFVMYGQTEATARISYVPPERLRDKIGSIGQAIPGGELSVSEKTGELVYRGENVMLGYAESPADLLQGDELQGVLHTGDLGRRDEEGFFYVTGRLKRFIKLAGNRVGLDEVEQALQQALKVPVAVAGEDDLLMAWLESTDQGLADQGSALLREHCGLHHSLFRVRCLTALPLLASGKTNYAALRSRGNDGPAV